MAYISAILASFPNPNEVCGRGIDAANFAPNGWV